MLILKDIMLKCPYCGKVNLINGNSVQWNISGGFFPCIACRQEFIYLITKYENNTVDLATIALSR